ncbi:hypothetical protein GCM10023172_37650 [Hymenobacter ginsengisoli]|uniref:DUF3592 domain-containing protein n=1 Tax=Hymenobacter ginsengisoli TaxID=1051626 RepID=A0ABP8QNI8_9BACT|nr:MULTISPECIES: hypothetical protein [unclassified Hymenobacter]MBO2032802.1 hypothetical protein [Hymenobacter sp. BT559]
MWHKKKRFKKRISDGYNTQKQERAEALKIVLVIVTSIAFLYYISGKYAEYEIRNILEDPAYATGEIMHVRSDAYVVVEFKAAGSVYSFRRRVPREVLSDYVVNDTIAVIYARTDPDNAAFKKGFAQLLHH